VDAEQRHRLAVERSAHQHHERLARGQMLEAEDLEIPVPAGEIRP